MGIIYQRGQNNKNTGSTNVVENNNLKHALSEMQDIQQVKKRELQEKKSIRKLNKKFKKIVKEKSSKEIEMDENVTDYMKSFLTEFIAFHSISVKGSESNIQVSDVLGSVARVYEKIRSTVEYKGENLLRRNAVERILKRLIWEKTTLRNEVNIQNISEHLIKELIWAKYLPNDELSLNHIDETTEVIRKYLYILENLDNLPDNLKMSKAKSWLLGVASSEIEDLLDPSNRDLFINLMYEWFVNTYEWVDENITEEEKRIQIYLSIHRSFTKSDDPIMRYYLLEQMVKGWKSIDTDGINKFILRFPDIYKEIERNLDNDNKLNLYRRISKFSAAFEIFKQLSLINKKKLSKIIDKRVKFNQQVRKICTKNYKDVNQRVKTGIIRSVIYIFITKVFFALLLEVPYEIFRYGELKYIPLTINIVFPPLMMFLVGLSIKAPGARNTEEILRRINAFTYKQSNPKKTRFSIEKTKGKSTLLGMFGILYLLLFVLVFGGISTLLYKIGFTTFGVIIFFFFLSLILLFAFRIKYQSNYLKVEKEKEGFISHIFSYLTLPFLNLGFYLSRGLAQINFFTLLLDFIIEAPLKNLIEIFEEWIGFIREKREEVIQVPE